MPGLSLGVMGGVRGSAGGGNYVTAPPSASVGQMAFGPGYTQPGGANLSNFLAPNDPAGIVFWAGILGVVGLYLIRRSLPG